VNEPAHVHLSSGADHSLLPVGSDTQRIGLLGASVFNHKHANTLPTQIHIKDKAKHGTLLNRQTVPNVFFVTIIPTTKALTAQPRLEIVRLRISKEITIQPGALRIC
jgi:hypothetical protein